jgi:glycosyltransferase involved in cell wall biosynthesis
MKIALVCPANMLYMPYVGNYTKILDEEGIKYDVIRWDRFQIEEINEFVFRDSKACYKRGFFDYVKYSSFVFKLLKKYRYDKIVIFGIQLLFFLHRYLLKKYKNKYIIDIRDYHPLMHCFNMKKAIQNATSTVLSSPAYKQWLPEGETYTVNHNTRIEYLENIHEADPSLPAKEHIFINYIGALREYQITVDFMNALKDSKRISLKFHGEGFVNKDIDAYLKQSPIRNVELTGRYVREQEPSLYLSSDMINALEPNDFINCKTFLTNRLYNAAIYGKPVIAFEGTYLSEVVKEYDLGLVIKDFNNTEDAVLGYIRSFQVELFDQGRRRFLEVVIKENKDFKEKVLNFVR